MTNFTIVRDPESDPVRDYLRERGAAEHVVRGGLDYLLRTWEETATAVARGEPQDYYEYTNDIASRQLLAEVMHLVPEWRRSGTEERVSRADELIRPHLIATEEPICGRTYTTEQWWYFHRPRAVNDTWT